MFHLNQDEVSQYRAQILAGGDGKLVVDIGYFLLWYSAVDVKFTQLFAMASSATDLETFDTICAGMDLRVKIERFRRIRKHRGGVGPNLNSRLTYIDTKCRPIRNRLAHCLLLPSKKRHGCYAASTLGSLPWDEFSRKPLDGNRHRPPVLYSDAQLLGWGGWLASFGEDLSAAFNHALQTGAYEIENPRSSEQPVDQGIPGRPIPPASTGKDAQTSPKKEK